ncbi:MAG: Uncharacterised protein [Acidimicrobiaceae bacterium]|nr:MAG: Uncharacterised protein [Acidimicrobiaceae bacterium]
MLCVALSCPTKPAACHVVPLVNVWRSRRTTSVQPSSVRWYAMLAPTIPPPIMTTCARSGIFFVINNSLYIFKIPVITISFTVR